MKVKLISHTPEAERKVAMAARLCYSAIGAAELEERLSETQVQTLVAVKTTHYLRSQLVQLNSVAHVAVML